jgi:hypothetical protein
MVSLIKHKHCYLNGIKTIMTIKDEKRHEQDAKRGWIFPNVASTTSSHLTIIRKSRCFSNSVHEN